MRTGKNYFQKVFLSVVMSMTLFASLADVCVSGDAPDRNRGVVAVHVRDRSGNSVVSATGIVVDGSGIIATSCYVIPKWLSKVENTLMVEMDDGASFSIEHLLSGNCNNNIALIQIRGNGLPQMELAPDYKPEQGESVSVIAMSPRYTVTGGRVRSVTRNSRLFQTTVLITTERDGSAVLNRRGQVIGIATFLPARKQNQPTVVSAWNIVKEFGKYSKRIHELSSAVSAFRPAPGSKKDEGEEDRAPLPERNGKYTAAESAFLSGRSLEGSRRYREAIEAYTNAIHLKRDYVEAYVSLGISYYKIEKYAEAVEAYKKAIEINPGIESVYNKLGAAYIILGEYSKALEAYKKAIALDPEKSETHFNLGIAYVLIGDRDGAVNEYIILKELDRKRAEKLLDLMY